MNISKRKIVETTCYNNFLVCVLIVFCSLHSCYTYKYKPKQPKCEKIDVSLCTSMRYNMTRMPNSFGHSNQREASEAIEEFLPLIRIGCSKLLRFFLCSRFAPICSEQDDDSFVVPPCRSLCVQVKNGCSPVLAQFSFNWPPSLDCQNLPVASDTYNICVEPPTDRDDVRGTGIDKKIKNEYFFEHDKTTDRFSTQRKKISDERYEMELTKEFNRFLNTMNLQGKISPNLCRSPRYAEITDTKDRTCVPRCSTDVLFSWRDKEFIKTWLTLWSVISVLSCAFTIISHLSGASDLKYPEKPALYVAVCSALQSAIYAARLLADNQRLHCDKTQSFLVDGDINNWLCTLFAVGLYYFDMAGLLWWVLLSFSWFLAAVRKWGQEAISSLRVFFHLFAWFVPGFAASALVATRNVEGDELLGVCKVGARRSVAVLAFSVTPFIFSLALGCTFTVIGFVSVFKVLRQLKTSYSVEDATRLERLIFRMGIFSVLYVTTGASQLICYLAKYASIDRWITESIHVPCDAGMNDEERNCRLEKSIVPIEIYLVQIFASLSVGVTTTTWVWSRKTLLNWGRLMNNGCRTTSCCQVSKQNIKVSVKNPQPHKAQPALFEANPTALNIVTNSSPYHLSQVTKASNSIVSASHLDTNKV